MGQGVSWVGLRFASALGVTCACGLLLGGGLGCGESRDLDALGIPRPPDGGGVFYLEEMQRDRGDAGTGDPGSSGGAGSGSAGSGASSGGGAGSGSSAGSSGGRAGSGGGSGAGSVPLPAAGTGGGFQFPGAGGSGGFPIPGGGGMQQPPPPSGDISACSPCESLNGSLGGVPACCTDDDQCGADLSALGGSAGCVDRDQPGAMTDQCPQVSIMGGGFQIPGCCLPSGECGIVIMRLAPLGCVQPQVVEDLLQFDMPSGRPQRCRP